MPESGLTARRIGQARSSGYLKSAGGKIPEMGLGGILGVLVRVLVL